MKKRYSLPLLQAACFMIVSLLLQNCGGSGNPPIELEEQKQGIKTRIEIEQEEQGQRLIEQQESNSLPTLMPELWQYIFSHLDFDGVLAARAVNRDWSELITGLREAGVVGVENKPSYIIDTCGWVLKKQIDFKSKKLERLTPALIISFTFYHLIGHVMNLPQEF
jgi:hypothetical protein